jgi:glycosyltransferase involved in cell wall biosynthesis
MEENKIKVMIGIPTASAMLHRKFVQSLMSLQFPKNCEVDFNVIEGYQLPFARNRIVQNALGKDADYLFFVDADMIFPPDTLLRLLSHDLDIVNSLAFRRIKPHYPCIFKWNEKEGSYETVQYAGGLVEVDATGMPAILIKTEVFKKMKDTWPGRPWYYYRDNLFSSDITFCENARKLGYKIMIDTDLKIGHLGEEIVITEDFYLHHLSEEAKKEHNEGVRNYIKTNTKEKLTDPSIHENSNVVSE